MCVPESYRFYFCFFQEFCNRGNYNPLCFLWNFIRVDCYIGMKEDCNSNQLDSVPFINNITLRPASHIHIELREIHGIQLNTTISEWDICEFLKSEFQEPFYDLKIQYTYFIFFYFE